MLFFVITRTAVLEPTIEAHEPSRIPSRHRFRNGPSTPSEWADSREGLAGPTYRNPEPGKRTLSNDAPLKEAIANLERANLIDALDASRWNQARAAGRLGLSYHRIRALLRKYPEIKKP